MRMYVANCTKQIQDFQFRRPEYQNPGALVRLSIPVGNQMEIPLDLSPADVDAIVAQHERYGFVPARDKSKSSEYNSLCYSLDKPVSVDGIAAAIQHNMEILQARGQKIREEAAVAINEGIESGSQANGAEPPKSTAIQIEEAKTPLNPDPEFNQTLVVDRNAPSSKRATK